MVSKAKMSLPYKIMRINQGNGSNFVLLLPLAFHEESLLYSFL